ncbi:Two-component sensor histidine kinase, contains HisKA and HATPase domains [Alkalispirochaeta americana]|uniref:histidine kinase n=1 Tax=Alkalispirochaeta americana TaxID=159291 RepID=A0A1N6N5Z8_9SPIO|nr:histidine kinase dimerization/phosphoacceptor domain -containing protein [Alkalispirochaeta americana]SIP87504.1 Two-component sensor histidine kinase, contains HisKA and HATPase domains [Alkalispirochaeta americana]
MKAYPLSLSLQYLLVVAVASVFFSGAVMAYQVRTYYQRGLADREALLETIGKSYLPLISSRLFYFDEEELELLLQGLVLLPHLEYGAILEARQDEAFLLLEKGREPSRGGRRDIFPLVYRFGQEDRLIGELQVTTSLKEFRQILLRQTSAIAAASVVQIFGFALVVFFAARRLIFVPLRKISEFLHTLDPARPSGKRLDLSRSPWEGTFPDELDEISRALNAMLSRADQAILSLEQTQDNLRSTLEEKQSLLQELYHRTRNTLQSVRAILKLRAAQARDNRELQETVRDVDNQILAMALVQQALYESQHLSRIDMEPYFRKLLEEILQSYGMSDFRNHVVMKIDPVSFLIDTAVPCGTLLVELVSNALKHAFPEGRGGMIWIILEVLEGSLFRLTVADDGVGVGADFDWRRVSTIGFQTLRAIGENQLQGQVSFAGTGGVRWDIVFSTEGYTERVSHG